MKMKRISVQAKLEEVLQTFEKGSLIVAQDFLDIGNYEAVKRALSRLHTEGKLTRVLRGLYQTPNYNAFLKKEIGPSPKKVAKKLAEKFGWTIAPAEDTALNELGLSTQVPAKYTFISDGPTKKYTLDNGLDIQFKHKTNKEISKLTTKEASVIEAIQTISQENMTDQMRKKILNTLDDEELNHLLESGKSMRYWIYDELKNIKEERDYL